ncbi:MAG: carbon-nitrogen hydrolase family protein [Lachnospiraceae bacterium]|nr:carbon-nitrogen hydrolase family protein [Lachnospiraceae bacterium]
MRIALVQMKTVAGKEENYRKATEFVARAAGDGADLVMLPEMFACPYETKNFPIYAEEEGGAGFLSLSEAARKNRVYLVGGSLPEKDNEGRIYNTSYVFDREGRRIAKHRKMHLFDIDVRGGQHFRESDTLSAGDSVTVFDTEFGRMGLNICYDFRFPELARLMVLRGAKLLLCPAAFNMTTGPAHWELMFRSRAVDNQVYAIGVAPARDEESSYISYANSLVVSPWGDVIARLDEKEQIKQVDLDLTRIEAVREQLPLLKQRRTDVYEIGCLNERKEAEMP